jgi:ubiquitin carboxyl-terminal hydrolase 25
MLNSLPAGRTAPAFAEDLTLYDPLHPPAAPVNLLRDPPLTENGIPELAHILPADTCKHEFCVKDRQSDPPALDARPDEKSIWKLSLICRHCRLHVELRVDYSIRWEPGPCPNHFNPLHHFVHSPWREDLARNQWRAQNPGSPDEIYTFECSSQTCSATVFVRLSSPIFGSEAVRTLTDEGLLSQRTTEAFKRWPAALEGVARPSVFDVIFDLRKYLRNTWDSSMDGKRIGLDNKRFVVRFGPEGLPCKDVLETARFTLKVGCHHSDPSWFREAADIGPVWGRVGASSC